MRRAIPLLLAAATIVTVTWASVEPASAARSSARYCLQGKQWGFPGNCAFATRHQCMATASGTGSTCGINPHYAARNRMR